MATKKGTSKNDTLVVHRALMYCSAWLAMIV